MIWPFLTSNVLPLLLLMIVSLMIFTASSGGKFFDSQTIRTQA
jgi:hypothetical protein